VDQVIEAGHDPRRFTEDLLERLRDLIVVQAVPDAAGSVLADVPDDQLERIRAQAGRFGPAELSRAADLLSVGLTEMRGATAPRLHLELMCARVLLPAAEDDTRALRARLDRLERFVGVGGMPSPGFAATPPPVPAAPPAGRSSSARPPRTLSPGEGPGPADALLEQSPAGGEAPTTPPALELGAVRGMWTEVLGRLAGLKRTTWTLVSQNATVADVGPGRLTLGFSSAGLRDTFARGAHPELVRQALIDVLGLDVTVEAIVDPSAAGGQPAARAAGSAGGESVPVGTSGPGAGPRRQRPGGPAPVARPEPHSVRAGQEQPTGDDPDVVDGGLSGRDLVVRELGATVIGEYDEN